MNRENPVLKESCDHSVWKSSTVTVTSKRIKPVLTLKNTTEEQEGKILKVQERLNSGTRK
jgi:hypothetical protein